MQRRRRGHDDNGGFVADRHRPFDLDSGADDHNDLGGDVYHDATDILHLCHLHLDVDELHDDDVDHDTYLDNDVDDHHHDVDDHHHDDDHHHHPPAVR